MVIFDVNKIYIRFLDYFGVNGKIIDCIKKLVSPNLKKITSLIPKPKLKKPRLNLTSGSILQLEKKANQNSKLQNLIQQ